MEVKVSVDGVPRVVCGVTEDTTCQEVVLALAQALGQPGRYILREAFKDFERCMTPNEHLMDSLQKYGEQAREVKLTLLHNGSSVCDEMSRTKVGRYQPCPPLRRKDAGTRMRRGSGSVSLHRQSLPPLTGSQQEADKVKEEVKRPKRKSLTLMEEAWEWLESLGKGKVYSTACDKESSKKTDKRKSTSLEVSLTVDKHNFEVRRNRNRGQKRSDMDHQTSCCMGSQTRGKESKQFKKAREKKEDAVSRSSCTTAEDEKNCLGHTIICQLSFLQDLQIQIAGIDRLISELEVKQRAGEAEREAEHRMAEEEMEQIQFWENELKAEEGYEKVLLSQFLEMKAKAVKCKLQLEEYKRRMQGLDFFAAHEDKKVSKVGTNASAASGTSSNDTEWKQANPHGGVNVNRTFPPRQDLNSPRALVPPGQIKERRPTGPTELREWWTRWSEAQSSQSQTKKVIHRSELTIYLASTKV